ncbi:MAG: marine proteobacterial sortase target protein [Desulfobulbaceae bacterium]|nr:marine proteobacterial sortase target protein [Desulfobulbaceae bacterium]
MKEYHNEKKKNGSNELQDPGNLLLLIYITAMVCILIAGVLMDVATATAAEESGVRPENVRRGELLVAKESGQLQPAPLMSQQVSISISGITARVKVEQHFVNNAESWIEAVYVFPLPDESSVDHLRLRVGERLLEGQIMEKEEARKTHEKAKEEGRKSSLLVQNRPNIFTTRVANIGPGEEVTVEIEYQQTVRFADDIFSLRFPMVVGPRYIPGRPLVDQVDQVGEEERGETPASMEFFAPPLRITSTGWAVDTDQVPDASEITPPVDLDGKTTIPVELTIDLAAGIPLSRLESLYHGIEATEIGEGHYSIRLTGEIKADRDFVLEWAAENEGDTKAALFAETLGNNQYMLLMLMPPQKVSGSPVPREMIFILDVSGSMAGTSIVQAKAAISLALTKLRPSDHFNIIVFSNSTHALFNGARPADQAHVQEASHYIEQVKADGGTEMKPALLLALDGSSRHERLRQVVFLTDGAVGNEDELLKLIARRLGDSRLFTVGIGSAPNSYFMNRAATMGRGTYSYIGKGAEVKEKMTNLFTKLEQPVISDLRLELAGSAEEIEGYPSPIPDLYLGEPLVLAVRTGWENATLRLTGTRLGQPWETLVDTSTYGRREGIGALWARKKIRSQMEALALGADREKVREEVLKTALEHHLVSKYTSLVAVDSVVSRAKEVKEVQAPVITHLPQGWQAKAVFGGGSQTASPAAMRLLIGVCLLAMAGLISIRRRVKWQNLGK